ncbi:hypothetical protein BCR35DRAFT_349824 [Leucosporidium creatinivorum]|uniref:F-box domain-containing protein n=1 Tax=Leucosporidium creatinivorum TaxID=106004 RepID=A0A1Y2G3M9_9BASI|nr:hypothetical protein BCR35DRAFT_349824 [Leucosporidium creatinivorum]
MATVNKLMELNSLTEADRLRAQAQDDARTSTMKEGGQSNGLRASTRASLLSLPDELLTTIAEHCIHKTTLKNLQLVAKRFDPLCKALIWQSVKIDGDFEYHDVQMTHLVATGLIPLVHELEYFVPSVFSALSAHHLSTFSALETLVLYPTRGEDGDGEEEDDDGSGSIWPKAITDALGQLPNLRDLTMLHGVLLDDPQFSLSHHLPRLHTFTFNDLGALSVASLFAGGPTLRYLDVPLKPTGIAAASACVGTLHSLIVRSYCMHRPVMRRRVEELGALFDSKNNGRISRPLRTFALDDLDLGPLEDGPAAERFDVPALLQSLHGVNLTTLRVSSIMRLNSTLPAQRDFQHAVSLPSLKNLQILGVAFTHGYLSLDASAVRELGAFLKSLPELAQLTLDFWVLPVTPVELAELSYSSLKSTLPDYFALLDFLRLTKVTEVSIDWRSPLSEYWGWSVHLHRLGDEFIGEAFDSEGMSRSNARTTE